MTSFVHVDQPTVHPGVHRAEVLFGRFQASRQNPSSARPLVLLLIVAMVAAFLVTADKLVSNWDEGKLLAAWTVLCAAAFAVLVLYGTALRTGAGRIGSVWQAYSQRRASAAADARFLDSAHSDPRVMNELLTATTRQRDEQAAAVAAAGTVAAKADTRVLTIYEAMRRMNSSRYY